MLSALARFSLVWEDYAQKNHSGWPSNSRKAFSLYIKTDGRVQVQVWSVERLMCWDSTLTSSIVLREIILRKSKVSAAFIRESKLSIKELIWLKVFA